MDSNGVCFGYKGVHYTLHMTTSVQNQRMKLLLKDFSSNPTSINFHILMRVHSPFYFTFCPKGLQAADNLAAGLGLLVVAKDVNIPLGGVCRFVSKDTKIWCKETEGNLQV